MLRPPPLVISASIPQPKPPPSAEPQQPAVPADARAGRAAPGLAAELEGGFDRYGAAFHVLSQVHARPADGAPVTAYMRRGAEFRARGPVPGSGCSGGWYALQTGGFICRGRGFLVGKTPQHFTPSPAPPARQAPLPYPYAKTVARDELQYWRVPGDADLGEAQAGLRALRARQAELALATPAADGRTPGPDAAAGAGKPQTREPDGAQGEGRPGPEADGPIDAQTAEVPQPRLLPGFVRMVMEPGFYVSLDAQPQRTQGAPGAPGAPDGSDGAEDYARTVRGAYVRNATLAPATLPTLNGEVLDAGSPLPLGFVYRSRARQLRPQVPGEPPNEVGVLPKYGRVALSGREQRVGRTTYAIARDGLWLGRHALRVAARRARPAQIPAGARWVHVSLSEQVLVAYEGQQPVFATLVSTGKEGFESPTGLFRIHAKHVSTTMDGAEGTDEAYSIEDVPWTMYFHGSIALHAAFWHDRFGRTRSHGCVNLAPADAQWLFQWSTPGVPPGQHGVMPQLSDDTTYVLVD